MEPQEDKHKDPKALTGRRQATGSCTLSGFGLDWSSLTRGQEPRTISRRASSAWTRIGPFGVLKSAAEKAALKRVHSRKCSAVTCLISGFQFHAACKVL
jgi:hypothetical protein